MVITRNTVFAESNTRGLLLKRTNAGNSMLVKLLILRWYWAVCAVVFACEVRKTVVLYFGEKFRAIQNCIVPLKSSRKKILVPFKDLVVLKLTVKYVTLWIGKDG